MNFFEKQHTYFAFMIVFWGVGLPHLTYFNVFTNEKYMHFTRDYVGFSLVSGEGFPRTISRTCYKNTTYPAITSVDDLAALKNDLECIYSAGIVPSSILLGPYYGHVLSVANSEMFNQFVGTLWKGKFAVVSVCQNPDKVYMIWNIIAGQPRLPALLSIGSVTNPLGPGEYDDNKGAFIIDYTQNFETVCPAGPNVHEDRIRMNVLNNPYPFNQIVDVVRIVGRDKNNAAILLGKTYVQDGSKENKELVTIAYWAIRSYDPTINPEFKSGDTLEPVEKTFHYIQRGLKDVASLMLLPIPQRLILEGLPTTAIANVYIPLIISSIKAQQQQFLRFSP